MRASILTATPAYSERVHVLRMRQMSPEIDQDSRLGADLCDGSECCARVVPAGEGTHDEQVRTEEMGRNSVSPCTIPRMSAWK